MLKSIGYAYPSSTMAVRLHRAKQGCYYIEFKDSEEAPSDRFYPIAFDCLKSADRAARDMHWLAWSLYSKRSGAPAEALRHYLT